MKSLAYPLLFVACIPLLAQGSAPEALNPPEQERTLSPVSRIKFEIPMFGSSGKAACDSSGNIVFNVGKGPFAHGPFLRVQADGRTHVIYSLPEDLPQGGNIVWTISPDGVFYVLHEDFREYTLIRFKSDGSVESKTQLQVPPGVDIWSLAVLNNETISARGYRDTANAQSTKREGFAAVFDHSGRVIRDLSANAPQFDLGTLQVHPPAGDVAAGEDGRFYVLEDKKVLVLNPAGQIENEFSFRKPSAEAIPVRIDVSKGYISIVFHSIHRTKNPPSADVEVRAMLLNAQSGEMQARFLFDPTTTGNVLCYNRQDGYSLMAIDGKMAAVDIVPVR